MGKDELVVLLCLSSWCLMIVVWLFRTVPQVCLQFVIMVFPDHTHLLFVMDFKSLNYALPAYAFLLITSPAIIQTHHRLILSLKQIL